MENEWMGERRMEKGGERWNEGGGVKKGGTQEKDK